MGRRSRWTRLALVGLLLVVSVATGQSPAATGAQQAPQFLDISSVRNNRIVWTSYSRYLPEIEAAIAAWEAVGPIDFVNQAQAPDEPLDLIYRDAFAPGAYFAGYWTHHPDAPDTITFSTSYMNARPDGDPARFGVAVHETGHALGLADLMDEDLRTALMFHVTSGFTAPQDHDIANLCHLWGGPRCAELGAATPQPALTPAPSPTPTPTPPEGPTAPVVIAVVNCTMTPDSGTIDAGRAVAGDLPRSCRSAPPGVVFDVEILGNDAKTHLVAMTNAAGLLALDVAVGHQVTATIRPASNLLYLPLHPSVSIPAVNDDGALLTFLNVSERPIDVIKLVCSDDPGQLDPEAVFAGEFPPGCRPSPAGDQYTVSDSFYGTPRTIPNYAAGGETFVTSDHGRFTVYAPVTDAAGQPTVLVLDDMDQQAETSWPAPNPTVIELKPPYNIVLVGAEANPDLDPVEAASVTSSPAAGHDSVSALTSAVETIPAHIPATTSRASFGRSLDNAPEGMYRAFPGRRPTASTTQFVSSATSIIGAGTGPAPTD